MDPAEMKFRAMMRLCGGLNHPDWAELREECEKFLELRAQYFRPEEEVRKIFLELGAPDHLAGHPYAVRAIVLVMHDWELLDNLSQGLYPAVARYFDTTGIRVERAIRNLVDVTWMRGDAQARKRYFGNIIHSGRGKPTNSEFIARLANVLRERVPDRNPLLS